MVKATADEGLEARKPPESGCQTPQHPTTQTAFNCPSWRVVLVNSDVRQQRARQTQLAPNRDGARATKRPGHSTGLLSKGSGWPASWGGQRRASRCTGSARTAISRNIHTRHTAAPPASPFPSRTRHGPCQCCLGAEHHQHIHIHIRHHPPAARQPAANRNQRTCIASSLHRH